eukprot:29053-Pelagococcus_subviridis.AAC.6
MSARRVEGRQKPLAALHERRALVLQRERETFELFHLNLGAGVVLALDAARVTSALSRVRGFIVDSVRVRVCGGVRRPRLRVRLLRGVRVRVFVVVVVAAPASEAAQAARGFLRRRLRGFFLRERVELRVGHDAPRFRGVLVRERRRDEVPFDRRERFYSLRGVAVVQFVRDLPHSFRARDDSLHDVRAHVPQREELLVELHLHRVHGLFVEQHLSLLTVVIHALVLRDEKIRIRLELEVPERRLRGRDRGDVHGVLLLRVRLRRVEGFPFLLARLAVLASEFVLGLVFVVAVILGLFFLDWGVFVNLHARSRLRLRALRRPFHALVTEYAFLPSANDLNTTRSTCTGSKNFARSFCRAISVRSLSHANSLCARAIFSFVSASTISLNPGSTSNASNGRRSASGLLSFSRRSSKNSPLSFSRYPFTPSFFASASARSLSCSAFCLSSSIEYTLVDRGGSLLRERRRLVRLELFRLLLRRALSFAFHDGRELGPERLHEERPVHRRAENERIVPGDGDAGHGAVPGVVDVAVPVRLRAVFSRAHGSVLVPDDSELPGRADALGRDARAVRRLRLVRLRVVEPARENLPGRFAADGELEPAFFGIFDVTQRLHRIHRRALFVVELRLHSRDFFRAVLRVRGVQVLAAAGDELLRGRPRPVEHVFRRLARDLERVRRVVSLRRGNLDDVPSLAPDQNLRPARGPRHDGHRSGRGHEPDRLEVDPLPGGGQEKHRAVDGPGRERPSVGRVRRRRHLVPVRLHAVD